MAAVSSSSEEAGGGYGGGIARREIMLFGVRVVVDPMRKCVSLNNLSDYEQPAMDEIPKIIIGGGERNGEDKNEADLTIAAGGYASANDAVQISSSSLGNRERKRGIPWTEDEHKLFLLGLQKVGKGDWKGISRNFVKSRTPTQVASHAQKYFLRRSNLNRRRRRSSLFDMTADTVTGMHMEQDQLPPAQENTSQSQPLVPETKRNPEHLIMQVFPITVPTTTGTASSYSSSNLIPVTFQSQPFNLNKDATNPTPLSLNLSLASSVNLNTRHSMMSSFSNGDSNSNSSFIRVA